MKCDALVVSLLLFGFLVSLLSCFAFVQACFAGGIGQGLYAAVIEIAPAIEYHFSDALCQSTLSDLATNAFEEARATVGRFLNASESREVVLRCCPIGHASCRSCTCRTCWAR